MKAIDTKCLNEHFDFRLSDPNAFDRLVAQGRVATTQTTMSDERAISTLGNTVYLATLISSTGGISINSGFVVTQTPFNVQEAVEICSRRGFSESYRGFLSKDTRIN